MIDTFVTFRVLPGRTEEFETIHVFEPVYGFTNGR